MKKNFMFLLSVGLFGMAYGQTVVTGPSSSQSPYLNPVVPGYTITSVLTATNVIGSYTMCGTPDGLGAFDNNDGTFTLLMNHEFGNAVGGTRAHGSIGAFISKWVINKTTLAVTSGVDLIQNVNLWNPATSNYSVYNSVNSSTLAAFGRFCSADLPEVSAFYNKYTGRGTQTRIFMNGEENGNEGRVMAHIVTGSSAGNSWELPYLGKYSCENAVACPYRNDKTIVIGMDDTSPLGQVYVYVGNKTNIGSDINKAGLTGGSLYGVAVTGLLNEVTASFPSPNTTFSLVALAGVQAITGASLNTMSNNLGVTSFLRPEDGAWDPSNPKDFYFATTDGFNAPSRLWKLRFTDIENPELGGTITAVLDGTEGQQMFDNIGIDHSGHILIVEDVGNQAHNGKMWEYTIATDALMQVADHDATRFIIGGANFLTQDEEASGIIDAQAILGPGKFLFVDQAHYAIPAPIVEGGQILVLNSAKTATSNPEANILGNAVSITSGNTAISTTNNTDFGTANLGSSLTETFVIQNTGTGPLVISSMTMVGTNAGDFSFVTPPLYPLSIAASGSQNFTVSFNPAFAGTRNATVSINNNDLDESIYDFAIQGVGAVPEINVQGNSQNILDGSTSPVASNNTDFGTAILNNPGVNKAFTIQNTGTGTLTVSGINVSGTNASLFTLVNGPTFPVTLAGGANQTFTVQYLPVASGTHTAKITVNNTDADEGVYDFDVQGICVIDVGITSAQIENLGLVIYPNPSNTEATVKMNLKDNAKVSLNVYNLTGANVYSLKDKEMLKGEQRINLNTSSFASGEYFVSLNSNGKSQTIKLVVQH